MVLMMRRSALMIAFVFGLMASASAQKAEIDAVNAKWIEFFNKGDFAGVAWLYTADATALPPGSTIVHGAAAIGAMWKSTAEHVSDPQLTTLDLKTLGPSAATRDRNLQLEDQGLGTAGSDGQVCCGLGKGRK
jgi:hypothetical protein